MLNNLIRFVANTKAKASEVNYNFDQVKAKIQELDDWKTSTDDRLNKYSSFQLFDIIATDRVLTGEEAKGKLLQGSLVTNLYPDAVAKIKEEWGSGAEQTYTFGEDISFPYRLAPNRHMIVDILYKDDVDALFEATGVAWFYIWDNANEQFYLPRSLWFDQYTNDPEKVNKYNEAGLPNIKFSFGASSRKSISDIPTTGMATKTLKVGWSLAGGGAQAEENEISVDASKTQSVYKDDFNTVQPPSSNKLLYFVVGNTYVNQEDIDIAQVESYFNQVKGEINTKLNITLDNATQTTKETSCDWAQLEDEYQDFGKPTTNTVLTAPADGKFMSKHYSAQNEGYLVFKKGEGGYFDPDGDNPCTSTVQPQSSNFVTLYSPYLKKGEKVILFYKNISFTGYSYTDLGVRFYKSRSQSQ